jgi:hypothetical protein
MNYGLSDFMVIEILVSEEIYTSVDKHVHTTKYRVHLAMIGFKLAALVALHMKIPHDHDNDYYYKWNLSYILKV